MSFMTNMICDELSKTCDDGGINQVLLKILSGANGVFPFCQSFPAVRMFLAVPNIRSRPYWYPKFRPAFLRTLHQMMTTHPPNLQLLEDFQGGLDPDSVHFQIMDGVNFAHSLIDQVNELVTKPVPEVLIR